MRKIGVLTSGGDAPGMNAAIRAVVRTAAHYDMGVVGIKRGYNGVLHLNDPSVKDFEELTPRTVGEIIHRGGTYLMTARCLAFLTQENQQKAVNNMREMGLEGLVVIGGDGSFRGVNAITKLGFPAVGIPGTIDNDLAFTDVTLGYDTALNTVCECVNHIRETSYSHERASVVEVMGRDCGDIALSAGLACGAERILIPETSWSVDDVADQIISSGEKGKKNAIVVVAEGAWASMKHFDMIGFCKKYNLPDYLAEGDMTSQKLALVIEKTSGQETRATVLGYIQRGGSPSAADRILACRMGEHAVKLLRDGIGGRVIGIRKNALIDRPVDEALAQKRRNSKEKYNAQLKELVETLSI